MGGGHDVNRRSGSLRLAPGAWHTEIVAHAAQPRRGLVLGAGGVLGAAWSVGALCALEESTGIDPRTCDYIVGTSAGAVLAALLGSGVTPGELRDHQRGLVMRGRLADLSWNYDRSTGRALPPLPRLGVGSPALVRRNAWRLRRLPHTGGDRPAPVRRRRWRSPVVPPRC